MIKLSDDADAQLRRRYGEPLLFSEKGNSTGLNEQYFAAYIADTLNIIYESHGKAFYTYNENNGIWTQASKSKITNLIGQFLLWYSKEYDLDIVQSYRKSSVYTSIMKLLEGFIEKTHAFSNNQCYYFHCADCVLEFDVESMSWSKKKFAPSYYSLNNNSIRYENKQKKYIHPNKLDSQTSIDKSLCPKFIEQLLENAMTTDDIEHLQLYMGQCLLGENISQTFLLLIGTPGGGKSTLVNVIEKLIGRCNCAELRLQHMTGRFEISSTRGKSLLTGKDVDSEFMNGPGARALKVLTGNDTVTVEYKNSNMRHDIKGTFNVIITSNNLLRIKFDGDIDAWRRRMLVIKYDNPPPEEKIPNFDDILLEEEGSGILRWAMNGTVKIMRNKGVICKSDEQNARVDMLLKSSSPFEVFGELFIHPTSGAAITTEEAVTTFFSFCKKMAWPEISERNAQKAFHAWMRTTYNAVLRTDIKRHGHNKRGYAGFQIRKKECDK